MNIKAVAKLARVSTATVSRTINGTATVNPKTAERVRKAIKELNFYPDTNARALGSGRSSMYGLIISDITNPFFPELVKAFEDIAVSHGQEVLVANTNYDPERMKLCVTRMLQRKVDGVAIMTSEMDPALVEVFSRRHIPLVFLDAGIPGPGVSNVTINYSAGVNWAIEHLVELGHRRIAFISGPMRLSSASMRYSAFMEDTAREHLPQHAGLIQEGNHRVDGGHAAMLRILDSGARPTAVVASNDLTAIGAMGAIAERGLSVPNDISVIGFDDIQLSAFTQPPLTTVSLSRGEIANAAFRALHRVKDKGGIKVAEGREDVIQPTMVFRRSTACAPGTEGTNRQRTKAKGE
ncbi:MAG: LacI family transcriptional regulator [Acidobacteriota bacterium]|nr:LacI family transcriptional regulator [Acidobacteriota bacterium]